MAVVSAEFRGIVSLDSSLIAPLTAFLREREEKLAEALKEIFEPIYGPIVADACSLATVLDLLQVSEHLPSGDVALTDIQEKVNAALWVFVEVLEGGVAELFEQLDQTKLEKWNEALAEVMAALVGLFQNHIQGLIHATIRLEELIWNCRDYLELGAPRSRWMRRLIRLGRFLLDRQILENLDKTLRFLEGRHLNWRTRFDAYVHFSQRAAEATEPLATFTLLHTLPKSSQDLYDFVLRMVKIWEIDAAAKAVLLEDIMRAVRGKVASDAVYNLFREYYQLLRSKLFSASAEIKSGADSLTFGNIAIEMTNFRRELTLLKRAIARYREFLLRTDPNPYVRSRWGFPEWIVGPEPENCRQLLQLELQVEALDRLYGSFIQSLTGTAAAEEVKSETLLQDIQHSLHTLSQPLISRHMMVAEGGRLMEKLYAFDELASTDPEAVNFVTTVLLRVLRYDCKFSVLFDNTVFQKVYVIHRELIAPSLAVEAYASVMGKCRLHIARILKWLKKPHGERQIGDLESLQQELTRYLSHLHPTAVEAADQMLDVRHMLGDFYHRLNQHGLEGRQIRGRFVAVDHLLEGLEEEVLQKHTNLECGSIP